jgi:Fe-S oxidoreductase
VTLTYRDEYPVALGEDAHAVHDGKATPAFRIQLLQEYLVQRLPELGSSISALRRDTAGALLLFGHCTERTEEVASQEQWRTIFKAFGLELQPQATGCCGMCGVYGHEAEHYEESRGVFDMSWGKRISNDGASGQRVIAQGHSCRSQVKRFRGFVPRHPMEALRDALEAATPAE